MIKKKTAERESIFEVESRLDQLLNHKHPMYILSHEIDWTGFESRFEKLYSKDNGRPPAPIRLMVGLHYLKYTYDLSDEEVIWTWIENAYWQYFTGETYFQKDPPIDPSSMTRFRNRLKDNGLEELLRETIASGLRLKCIKPESLERITVDTTVQEKNIAFPTDIRLQTKMINKLVLQAKKEGGQLRQTYRKVCKIWMKKHSGYMHANQLKRASSLREKVKIRLGRIVRDIERKITQPSSELKSLLELADRLMKQKRKDKNKIYSLHELDIDCISKGKAHKKYEFGCKVSIVSTLKEGFLLSCEALHGNPFDGHTLRDTITKVTLNSGTNPSLVVTDKGYRGHKCEDLAEVVVRGVTKTKCRYKKKLVKRQSLIEAMIGHLKSESRMDRNYLKGKLGDKINSVLCAAGQNMRKLIKYLRKKFFFLHFLLFCWLFRMFPNASFQPRMS